MSAPRAQADGSQQAGKDGPATDPDPTKEAASAPRAAQDSVATDLARAQLLTTRYAQALKAELTGALSSGGPGAAVDVCQTRAPDIAREVLEGEERSWTLHRTGARVRNPAHAPTDWQRRGLEVLAKRLEATDDKSALIQWHEVSAEGELRYLRAIPMAPMCLTCHGETASIPGVVRERLAELYPADQATGFSVGELRGAFVVTVPRAGR